MEVESIIQDELGRAVVGPAETLQSLWSGYGAIQRYRLAEGDAAGPSSVIVKHVSPPDTGVHPRGWNTSRSHERKLRSYEIETHWYARFAGELDASCRVAECYAVRHDGAECVLLLEDLDASGYQRRIEAIDEMSLFACLEWLGRFHAKFLGVAPDGLWPVGTYWHLDTRPR